MPGYYIVMGDIVKSSTYEGREMMQEFRSAVDSCNNTLAACILSPYTITLGDEFQGVAESLICSVQSLFSLEESLLGQGNPFKLRYVVHYGEIVTPINPDIAHEMVGPGLANARNLLTDKHKRRPRFVFDLLDKDLSRMLTRLFGVVDSLVQDWSVKDLKLVLDMLSTNDDTEIMSKYGKNRSQIWKRRRSLHISDYVALKECIFSLSGRGLK